MKNIVKLFPVITIAVAITVLPSTGCADHGIKFTASAPAINYTDLLNMEKYAYCENRKKEDDYNAYKEFTSYYDSELKDKINGDVYFLYPEDGLTGWAPHFLNRIYCLYAEGIENNNYINPKISQKIELYDKSLNKNEPAPDNVFDGATPWNISLNLIIRPVSVDINSNSFKFEFGNNNNGFTEKYFNIYINQTCLGTCYYKENNVTAPYHWFENYFNNNFSNEVKK